MQYDMNTGIFFKKEVSFTKVFQFIFMLTHSFALVSISNLLQNTLTNFFKK
jgi:hypothetical protein